MTKSRRRLRVLVLMHPALVPPDSQEGHTEREAFEWKTEYDVVTTLRKRGHEVRPLGVSDDLHPIRDAVEEWKPHVVFSLLEEFYGLPEFGHHVTSYLELLRVPYTGCNPRGLVLARDKALAKKILAYHRVRSPGFAAVRRGQRVRKPRHLTYPMIVKSLTDEASLGIAQASVVDNDAKLEERVKFIHESIQSDALIEEFIDGRELYVAVLGNTRLQVLPTWELKFENMAPGDVAIATAKVKHDPEYQEKHGIVDGPAALDPAQAAVITRTSRRVYRALALDGYARLDYRLRPDGALYFLEANPNPEIAQREEFAAAAAKAGMSYPKLLERIVALGIGRGSL
ncbi:MAG: D-alanine--D-alanine ligase [bacterium]